VVATISPDLEKSRPACFRRRAIYPGRLRTAEVGFRCGKKDGAKAPRARPVVHSASKVDLISAAQQLLVALCRRGRNGPWALPKAPISRRPPAGPSLRSRAGRPWARAHIIFSTRTRAGFRFSRADWEVRTILGVGPGPSTTGDSRHRVGVGPSDGFSADASATGGRSIAGRAHLWIPQRRIRKWNAGESPRDATELVLAGFAANIRIGWAVGRRFRRLPRAERAADQPRKVVRGLRHGLLP